MSGTELKMKQKKSENMKFKCSMFHKRKFGFKYMVIGVAF